MTKKNTNNYFWMSFSDLMTSLFFVVLVLYVLTYVMLKNKENELESTVEDLQNKLAVYDMVEENLKPLKEDTQLFQYEQDYKRFVLAFNVKFAQAQYAIKRGHLEEYDVTISKILAVGQQLKNTIDHIADQKRTNPALENISYLVIISGYASKLSNPNQWEDYSLSYKRAYYLWVFWKENGIDFEDVNYKGLVDLQISGNGWGGVGRFESDPKNQFKNEAKNQRFIIQIIPKIGDANAGDLSRIE